MAVFSAVFGAVQAARAAGLDKEIQGFLGGEDNGVAAHRAAQLAGLESGSVLSLVAKLKAGSLAGKTVEDWGVGPGSERRDFFRFVAVALGWIDPGYASRPGGGPEALGAALEGSRRLDAALGTRLAAFVSAADPRGWTRELLAVPISKLQPAPPPAQQSRTIPRPTVDLAGVPSDTTTPRPASNVTAFSGPSGAPMGVPLVAWIGGGAVAAVLLIKALK